MNARITIDALMIRSAAKRMGRSVRVEIRELTPHLLPDYLRLLDNAFRDFPDWAGCYCAYYDSSETYWNASAAMGPKHRASRIDRISNSKASGLLAFVDDEPVGWCYAQRRASFVNMRSYKVALTDPEEPVGSIMCLLVLPAFRREGICTALIDGACSKFQRDGLEVAEGYPTTNDQNWLGKIPWSEANFKGPLSAYLKNGFKIHRQLKRFAIVRKPLCTHVSAATRAM